MENVNAQYESLRRCKEELSSRIEREVYKKWELTGQNRIYLEIMLTDREKKVFMDIGKFNEKPYVYWEFNGNVLEIVWELDLES